MQTNHQNDAPGIDKSRRMIRSWSKALQLGR
jgi:hypothetical protein